MQPMGSRKDCKGKRCLCAMRCLNLEGFSMLSSSAHVLYSSARCITSNSMWCRAAHPAANFRKVPRGSAVLHDFSVRASAAVLSEAAGNAKCHALARRACLAVMARANCASVSKHAMYCCGEPESCGQRLRIWSAVQDSANHAQCCAVAIHPPIPMRCSSAMASAAAKQARTGGCCRVLKRSCAKQCCNQRIAALLSLPRWTSERMGSAMRIQTPFCAGVTLGRSCWQEIFAGENDSCFDRKPQTWRVCNACGAVVSESSKGCCNC